MEPYLASILLFAGNFAIRGWALCYGQIVAIAQNQALFSLLGTYYGGDGVTNFALPDLRGRVPVGMGQAPGLPNFVQGETGGSVQVTLTINQMPAHNHTLSGLSIAQSASTAQGTTNVPGPTLVPAALPVIGGGPSATTIKGYAAKDNTTTLAPMTASGNVGMTGGSLPVSIQNPYLVLNYQIALEGIFPSRN